MTQKSYSVQSTRLPIMFNGDFSGKGGVVVMRLLKAQPTTFFQTLRGKKADCAIVDEIAVVVEKLHCTASVKAAKDYVIDVWRDKYAALVPDTQHEALFEQ